MPIRAPDKIDVGVGVYRDGEGRTPILRAVKAAEQRLWEQQETKAYLGGRGDTRYTELLRPSCLARHAGDARIVGLHTPGGCGALVARVQAGRGGAAGRARAGRDPDLAQPYPGDRRGAGSRSSTMPSTTATRAASASTR